MKLHKFLLSPFTFGLLALLQISAAAQTPGPVPSIGVNRENPTQDSRIANSPTVGATEERAAQLSQAEQDSKRHDIDAYTQGKQDFPVYLEAFSTLGLLIFAAIQMRLANRSTKAAEDAAKASFDTALASKDAAEASRRGADTSVQALRADRPYLLIKSATLENFQTEREAFLKDSVNGVPVRVNFGFENFGKSPAVIQKIRARLVVTKAPIPLKSDALIEEESYPKFGEYEACEWVERLGNVIAVGDSPSAYSRTLATRNLRATKAHLSAETFERIIKHQLLIVLHGFIRYTDVLQRAHETEFIGFFDPNAHEKQTGSFNFQFDDHLQRENEGG